MDGNGYIDLKELAEVSETSHEEAKRPFVDADADDDDQISPSEFEKAPWSLQGKIDDFKREDANDDNEDDILDEEDGMMMEVGEPVIRDESDEDKLKTVIENNEENENPTDEEVEDYEGENIKRLEADDDENDGDDDDDDIVKEEPLEDESDDDRSISDDDILQEDDDQAIGEIDDDEEDDDNEEIESDIVDPRLLEDDVLRGTGYTSEEETVENEIY